MTKIKLNKKTKKLKELREKFPELKESQILAMYNLDKLFQKWTIGQVVAR